MGRNSSCRKLFCFCFDNYIFYLFLPRFYCNEILLFFQAEDGIRDAQESRGLGDVYKRQMCNILHLKTHASNWKVIRDGQAGRRGALGKGYFDFGLGQFWAVKGLNFLRLFYY